MQLWVDSRVEQSREVPHGPCSAAAAFLTPALKTQVLSSAQLLSCVQLYTSPETAVGQAFLQSPTPRAYSASCPLSRWCHPAISSSHPLFLPPLILPSIRVFSNESALHIRWPKYWSFSFSISPSNEYLGLISSRKDWLDLLTVQGPLKGLFQHHSSKASILQCSAFFVLELSHPYRTTGKTIALTRRTFVGKVMSLLFSMLSRLVITFLPSSKRF